MIELIDRSYDEAFESTLTNEGYEGMPYMDTKGNLTVGHGLKLPLSEVESKMIARYRMSLEVNRLKKLRPVFNQLPLHVRNVIAEMAYQLGAKGTSDFIKMWKALEKWNFEEAAKEMLDSKWAEQTSNRAERLASIILNNEDS